MPVLDPLRRTELYLIKCEGDSQGEFTQGVPIIFISQILCKICFTAQDMVKSPVILSDTVCLCFLCIQLFSFCSAQSAGPSF